MIEIAVALINTAGIIAVAWIVHWVRRDVMVVKHATNSMKDELVRLARISGIEEGRQLEKDENKE